MKKKDEITYRPNQKEIQLLVNTDVYTALSGCLKEEFGSLEQWIYMQLKLEYDRRVKKYVRDFIKASADAAGEPLWPMLKKGSGSSKEDEPGVTPSPGPDIPDTPPLRAENGGYDF